LSPATTPLLPVPVMPLLPPALSKPPDAPVAPSPKSPPFACAQLPRPPPAPDDPLALPDDKAFRLLREGLAPTPTSLPPATQQLAIPAMQSPPAPAPQALLSAARKPSPAEVRQSLPDAPSLSLSTVAFVSPTPAPAGPKARIIPASSLPVSLPSSTPTDAVLRPLVHTRLLSSTALLIPPPTRVPLIRPPPVPDDALPAPNNPLAPFDKAHPSPTVAMVPLQFPGPATPRLQSLLPVARLTASAASSVPSPAFVTTISLSPVSQSPPAPTAAALSLPIYDHPPASAIVLPPINAPPVAPVIWPPLLPPKTNGLLLLPQAAAVPMLTAALLSPTGCMPLRLPLPDDAAICQLRRGPIPAVTRIATAPLIPSVAPVARPLPPPAHDPLLAVPPVPDDPPPTPNDKAFNWPRGGLFQRL
ncbi:hypothetical protein AX14_009271, partial [Amanita brunnescens Koide BX004]